MYCYSFNVADYKSVKVMPMHTTGLILSYSFSDSLILRLQKRCSASRNVSFSLHCFYLGGKNHGTQRIETSGLILRRAQMTDALPMFRNWASDPEVTKFLTWPTYQSVDSAYYILDKAVIRGIELSFMAIGEYLCNCMPTPLTPVMVVYVFIKLLLSLFFKEQFLDAVFLSLSYLKLFLRKFELAGFCDRIYT